MKLEKLLSTRGLIQHSPTVTQIRERVEQVDLGEVKIFYGETFDDRGHTIDSMKYYFFVASLAAALQEEGHKVIPTIVVADTAACRNVKKTQHPRFMRLGKERARFVEQVNDKYGTGLQVVLMSDYIDTEEFILAREEVMGVCSADAELMQAIEDSVPESRRDAERRDGFFYSFDEVATIIDLDVKVGPPREDLYDNIAREVANRMGKKGLMSLFLTPTFPLGKNWSYFFAHDGIEDHGITAYKAGSKELQDHRVLIGQSTPEQVGGLIDTSFLRKDPALPNPVLDLGIICEMARQHLEGVSEPITLGDDFYAGRISTGELKAKVKVDANAYILSKF